MKTYLAFISFFIFGVLQSCSNNSQPSKKEGANVQKAKPAPKLATVQSVQRDYAITLPGELLPYEQVNIYPKIKAFVKKIYVDRGSYVRKGALLATLEAPEVGEQYSAQRSSSSTAYQKYLFSKQAYERLKEASRKNGAVAGIELDRAYAQLLGDSAAYQSSRSQASASGQLGEYLTIRAPFEGVITGRFNSEGALVGEGNGKTEPLFTLAQQNKLRLTVSIPEKEAQWLPVGTKASFIVVDLPGKVFSASLSRNSGALDQSTRSVVAEFDLDNAQGSLRAGQYAQVTIQLKRATPTLWVPSTSVVQAQSGVFVIQVQNGETRRVPVQTGVRRDSVMEVFGDLSAGDRVLMKGSEEVKDGSMVRTN